jgi:HEAT repeat protein
MNRQTVSVWAALCLTLLACWSASPPPLLPAAQAASLGIEDRQTLHDAGLADDGPALLAFFHARARTEVDRHHLNKLLHQFAAAGDPDRSLATAEFLGLGPLALPVLRQAANDLDRPEVAERAARCLPWLEGSAGCKLLVAGARALAVKKPDGAAAALLAYLPCTDDTEVIEALQAALAAVAAPAGKVDPALLRGLADPVGIRRAAAGIALCRADLPQRVPAVRELLRDPAPGVRLRTALALAEAYDAEAIPVLIDLLADLPAEQRRPVEELLERLAGEWAPAAGFASEDRIGRRIRHDAWAAWWRNTDGAALLAVLREHTLTAEGRVKVADLIAHLDSTDFSTREKASKELFSLGRVSLPQLREAAKSRDPEVARRARLLIDSIEREPAHHLPAAAVRLLALRKPAGCAEALVAYLPYAEDDTLAGEVEKSLTALARQDGQLNPVLVRSLKDGQPVVRAAVAEALIKGGGPEAFNAVRKLLPDPSPVVRLRIALALARARERDGVPVLIDLLTALPDDQLGQVEDALFQLAGDHAPDVSMGEKAEERKKCRDAWAAWWKANAENVDLARLTTRPWFGYTLICDLQGNRVYEVDRTGKVRWSISGAGGPTDARVLPGNRVLIAEYGADRLTERDFKGNILWERRIANPVNVQRFANGNTFVGTLNGPIVELDRSGKEVRSIANLPGNTLAAHHSGRGIVGLTQNGQCVVMETDGRQLRTFASGQQGNCMGCIDRLPNGRILVAQVNRNKVVEFDAEGKTILEVDAANPMSATGLPNGHFLVAFQAAQRVCEIDRTGKIVWDYPSAGQVVRARRR